MCESVFAVAKNTETVSCECGRGLTLRVQISGMRQVITTQTQCLKEFMYKNGLHIRSRDSLQGFFKNMSKEVIDAYTTAGYVIYHATVGVGYGLILPFDWVFAERAQRDADSLGVRVSF
jgi:hypothetical protein